MMNLKKEAWITQSVTQTHTHCKPWSVMSKLAIVLFVSGTFTRTNSPSGATTVTPVQPWKSDVGKLNTEIPSAVALAASVTCVNCRRVGFVAGRSPYTVDHACAHIRTVHTKMEVTVTGPNYTLNTERYAHTSKFVPAVSKLNTASLPAF